MSKEYLIGTGGWAYFQVPNLNPLVAYAKAFDFVEVNSTFYQLPPLKEVERWRKLVPLSFQFAVRGHRSITHKHKFAPIEETLEMFDRTKKICSILKAEILHLQIPATLKLEKTLTKNLQNLVSSVNLGNLRLVLETRGIPASKLPAELSSTMQEHNMIHCTDVSKGELPAYRSDVLYSRLFGKGNHNVYQPTDEELAEIDRGVSKSDSQKIVLSFHFVKMYKDAARLKIYKQTGEFPKITGSTGLPSLEEVLSEDAKFPSTKQELVENQGWKLFDTNEEERAHARKLIIQLPERTYNDVNEVMNALHSIGA